MSEEADKPLVERLRAQSGGHDEWRVQDPKDGSYCMAYSWPESMNPEREARAWLADHKARFPNSQHAHFVVACVRVHTQVQRLMLEAADEIERLRAALAYAVQEAEDWHDDCRGTPIEDERMDAARALLAAAATSPAPQAKEQA